MSVPGNPARDALELARAALRAGNPARALPHYETALRADGSSVEVLYELAMVHAHLGRLPSALGLVERALAQGARIAQLHFLRGELLRGLKRAEEAAAAYQQALDLDPGHVDAMNDLGDTFVELGRVVDALPLFERALALFPNHVPALNNRANALQMLGRSGEALEGFARALVHSPGNPYVLFNRGNALLSLRRFAEAESDSRQVLAQDPGNVGAQFVLGKSLLRQGKQAAALATFDRLIAAQPGNAAAWCDRGAVYAAMGRHREAWDNYNKSLALDPDLAIAWYGSAMLYSSVLQHEAALECFRRVHALQPDNAEAISRLGESLRTLGRVEEALIAFSDALRIDPEIPFARGQLSWLRMHRCDWQRFDADAAETLAGVRAGKRTVVPLDMLVLSDSGADQLACARTYTNHLYRPPEVPLWRGEVYSNPRIRVAYLSADFRDHAVSLLIAGLLEQHDRSRFEVFGYSLTGESGSEFGTRARNAFEHFASVKGLSDADVARQLREQQIDIVVDLMGPTLNARPGIFAQRPCPVQVNYLGYAGTMGASFLDYIIADAHVIPPGMEQHYAEKVVRLPDTFQCNDSKRAVVARAPSRAEAGLPPQGAVYCVFNNTSKLTPAVFDLWMRVLREVPGSVLWLAGTHPIMQANLRREAQARAIEPDRLVFASRVESYAAYLERISLADAFLDTLPYNAHTTASDVLWAGVPVVTRPGEAFAARVAASLLHALGMPELIASSPEEYVALAVRLGADPAYRAATKSKLAANRATQPLFDTSRFRRHLEAAYLAMWQRTQRGEPPDHITVAAAS